MALRISEFYYHLPEELVAAYPTENRLNSRLMVIDRSKGSWSHHAFTDLASFLSPQDLLILNNTKVIPTFFESTDGRLTGLLVEETSPRHWTAMVKPGKYAKPGQRLFLRTLLQDKFIEAEVLRTLEDGCRVLRFFESVNFETFGQMPLPPYILKRRTELLQAKQNLPIVNDRERYQTVYAEHNGSVAAPTAGLHFTPEFLQKFNHAFVTLHVGMGTFRPIKTEFVEDHEMHSEKYSIPSGLKEKADLAQRVVAVGTTSARVIESHPTLKPHSGSTQIFIYPPYTFRRVQALLTNFHLPHSTLLMLVAAFAGSDLILAAYHEAVKEKYRFFSYGDAMLIL